MVDISRKTYKRKDVKTILDGNGTLWQNEKHIGERLGHKNLRSTTVKYHSDHKNKLLYEPKKQPNRIFRHNELETKAIINCRKIFAHKFRTKFKFKHYDEVLTKERLVLKKVKSSFERKKCK